MQCSMVVLRLRRLWQNHRMRKRSVPPGMPFPGETHYPGTLPASWYHYQVSAVVIAFRFGLSWLVPWPRLLSSSTCPILYWRIWLPPTTLSMAAFYPQAGGCTRVCPQEGSCLSSDRWFMPPYIRLLFTVYCNQAPLHSENPLLLASDGMFYLLNNLISLFLLCPMVFHLYNFTFLIVRKITKTPPLYTP